MSKIVINEHDCWKCDLTKQFPEVELNVFISGTDDGCYEATTMIKMHDNSDVFPQPKRDEIMNFINRRPNIMSRRLIDDEKQIITQVKVEDNPYGTIRYIRLFGTILQEIGINVYNGKETIYSLFNNPASYEACIGILDEVYGPALILDESELSSTYGLAFDPPLFDETALLNKVQFELQRKAIDHYLKTGEYSQEMLEKIPPEFLRKARELAITASENWPLIVKIIEWLLKLRFPELQSVGAGSPPI